MNIWDHAEVIDLTTAAATAGAASLTTAQISGLTTSSILVITADALAPATITTSTVTPSAISGQITALPGVFSTVTVGGLTATSDTTGALSSVLIQKEATYGTALITAATIVTAATAATAVFSTTQIGAITTAQISGLTATTVYIDNVAFPLALSTTGTGGITATTLASDLDALAGIGAAASSGAVTVTFDAAGSGHSFGVDFIGSTFTDGHDRTGLISGEQYIAYINGSTTGLTVQMSGITKTTLAADLDALAGISAAVVSNDVVVTFDTRGSAPTIRFDRLACTVTPGLERVTLASGVGTAADLGHTGDYTGLHVGVAGDVKLDMARSGSAIVFKALPAGIYPLAFSRVHGSGTTATDLKGLRASTDGMRT